MNLQTAAANEEGFYGVNESNPGRIVKLTYYDWVASNISPAFVADNLMRKYKTGGFCEIPPGNSRAEEDKAPLPNSVQTWLDNTPQDEKIIFESLQDDSFIYVSGLTVL